MLDRFPAFTLLRGADGALRWEGWLEPVPARRFLISVRYPPHYPYAAPVLHVITPSLRSGSPHRYADGSLCVHKMRWDPATGTAASCVPLAAAWLVGYISWVELGESF